VSRAWRAWVALLDRKEPATSLAVVRILVAAVILADLIWMGVLGVPDALYTGPAAGGMGHGAASSWAVEIFGDSSDTAWALFALAMTSAVALLVGAFTRVSAVVLALTTADLARILPEADRGIDTLLRVVLVVLALSSAGETLSVDSRRRNGWWTCPVPFPAWPRYLLVGQLVWLYFSAAMHKLQSPWTPMDGFSALHYILLDPHFALFDTPWIGELDWLTRTATFVTVTFEWTAPLVLLAYFYRATKDRPGRLRALFQRTRFLHVWIGTGVVFHLMLAATMKLGIFPFGVLAVYPAFFAPEEITVFVKRARARARRARARG
jgi:hypothetical protein